MNISKENALIALNEIRNVINSDELCAEAMVAEIAEIIAACDAEIARLERERDAK